MTPFGQPPFCRLEVEVWRPEPLDPASGGPVRLVAITGGRVLGGLCGHVLPGGADWQRLRDDGALEIDARYLLELDDGARIEVHAQGLRAAGASGFWSSMRLSTLSQAHADLNQRQFLALGRKLERFVAIEVYALPDIPDL
jgi:hypothetical protein